MIITIPHGVIWMVSGGVIGSLFALIINTYYTGKLINVGFFKQMADLLPIFGVSFLMWIAIHTTLMLVSNIFVQLSIGICIGGIVYLLVSMLLLKSEWNEIIDMLPDKFKMK